MLLCLGLYLIFPACHTFLELRAEKSAPYELTANASGRYISLDTISQIEGIERVSPVLRINGELAYEAYTLSCEIKAVYSSYPKLKFTDGTMYPDQSVMPYLVLNKAAAKSFALERETMSVTVGDTVVLSAEGSAQTAAVCGIFDDGSDIPAVYMGYDTASRFTAQDTVELAVSLTSKGAAQDVVSDLQKRGFSASFDANVSLAWNLMGQQALQSGLTSAGFLLAAAILMREKRSGERRTRKGEPAMLLLSGLTGSEVRAVFPLRLALTEGACLSAAAILSATAGIFSLLGMGAGICLAAIHCGTVMAGDRESPEA